MSKKRAAEEEAVPPLPIVESIQRLVEEEKPPIPPPTPIHSFTEKDVETLTSAIALFGAMNRLELRLRIAGVKDKLVALLAANPTN